MKDVKKLCGRCGHEHAIGILRYSADNVPLYGARECTAPTTLYGHPSHCGCRMFVEAVVGVNGEIMLPAAATMSADELGKLWKATAYLSPQTPAETRIAVRQLDEITDPREREKAYMALVISHVTDIRAAMTKDESKFANLVSHADEVVEGMRGVVQLSERLTNVNGSIRDVHERIDNLERGMLAIAKALGIEIKEAVPSPETPDTYDEYLESKRQELAKEGRVVFATKSSSKLRDEAVVVDGTTVDPDAE